MITREEIEKIARLAKLSVADEDLDALTAQMGDIIAFADTINAAGDVGGSFDNVNHLSNAFREDVVVPSFDREDILSNVDGGEDGFFPIRKRQ